MGNYNALDLSRRHLMAHVYGNCNIEPFTVTLPTGATAGQTVDFARLPKNIEPLDFYLLVGAGNTGATTINVGLAQVPGGLATQEDEDYFLAAAALNSAARLRWGNVNTGPIVLDSDYFLRGVLGGEASAGAAIKLTAVLTYKFHGNL